MSNSERPLSNSDTRCALGVDSSFIFKELYEMQLATRLLPVNV